MEQTVLQKRIEARAAEKVQRDIEQAFVVLSQNPILERLRIGKLQLVSRFGHCPGTDLFHKSDCTLLRKETNLEEVRAELMQKYIEIETDGILAGLTMVSQYLQDTA